MKAVRNGKIELMRFLFALIILFLHIGSDLFPDGDDRALGHGLSFFAHGRSGVEFFFLLSGFFCASLAYKQKDKKSSIGKDTYEYIKGKIVQILPYHIFANLGLMIIILIYSNNVFYEFVNKLPSLFFLQKTGISDMEFNGVEWYIGSMLFALCIIYPLLRKSFDMVAYVVAPVVSTLSIGYFIHKFGKMPTVYKFKGVMYMCNIRALAVMLLGVFCFVMAMKLKEKKLSKFHNAILIITENVCWVLSLAFCVSTVEKRFEGYFVYVVAIAITICLSRNMDSKIYNNRFVLYLGKLSLPLYLSQNIARHIFTINFSGMGMLKYTVLVAGLALVVSVICKEVCDYCVKRIKNKAKTA